MITDIPRSKCRSLIEQYQKIKENPIVKQALYRINQKLEQKVETVRRIASHDGGTPLTVQRGNLDLLLEGMFGELTYKQKGLLKLMLIKLEDANKFRADTLDSIKKDTDNKKYTLDEKITNIKEVCEYFNTVSNEVNAYIKEILATNPSDVIQNRLGMINKHAFRLKNLSKNTYDLLNTNSKQRQECNLTDIARSAYENVKQRINDKNQSFNIKFKYSEITAEVNPFLMETVFKNLIDNASKYTQDGGKIEIKIREGPANVHICIDDNGIGVPKKERNNIFNISYRVNPKNEDKNEDSNGFGLAIVKDIIEDHNGSVWYEAKKGGGSSFHIELPKSEYKRMSTLGLGLKFS